LRERRPREELVMSRDSGFDNGFCFIRSVDGDYAVQVSLPSGEFIIITDDLTYPGGIGWAASWEAVPEDEVPEENRRQLKYAVEAYIDYVLGQD
jgi:hypothetical protein